MPTLTIELLGLPSVRLNGEKVTLPRPQSEAVWYYILAADKPTAVGELLDVFWPGQGRDAAQSLYDATSDINVTMRHKLREAGVAEPLRVCVRDRRQRTVTFRWDGALHYDVVTFQNCVKMARGIETEAQAIQALEKALELYRRGPFLASVSVQGAYEFDTWISDKRRTLASLYAGVLRTLSIYYMTRRAWSTAIEHLEDLRQVDPEAEVVYGLLMVCYAAVGKISPAEETYRHYTQMLEALPQLLPPNASLTALSKILREGRLQPLSVETLVERALGTMSNKCTDITLQQVLGAVLQGTGVQKLPPLSPQYYQVEQKAQEEAGCYGDRLVGTPHLFLALCALDPTPMSDSLGEGPVSLDAVIETVRFILKDADESLSPPTQQTLQYQNVLQAAERLANQQQEDRTDLLYLWVALLQAERGLLRQVLTHAGIDCHTVSENLAQRML